MVDRDDYIELGKSPPDAVVFNAKGRILSSRGTRLGDGYVLNVPMISIVDDDESVRESTKALVRSLGYSARTYASAEEFLRSGRLDDTDCLITDVHMKGLSGVELQSLLNRDGHRIPVIFVTASPDENCRKRVLHAGAIAYLNKPFSDEILIDCLDLALTVSAAETPRNDRN